MSGASRGVNAAVPPALGAGAALAAMLFASRLPVTVDFILPRRAGWPLFALAHEALAHPWARRGFAAVAALLFVGSLARFGAQIGRAVRGREWTPAAFLARGLSLALVVLLLRWSFAIWFEVSQKAWFPYGSLNALEPLANLVVCSLIVFAAMTAALACLSRPASSPSRALLSWAAVDALAAALAAFQYGAWRVPPETANERRRFVVLTEEESGPSQAVYDLPVPKGGSADEDEGAVARAGVRRLDVLRELYETRAKLMDADGLRRVLLLGVKAEDDLARALLLEHLTAAAPSPEALGALGALADETAHRIGPLGASRIALAYAHLGDAPQAAAWARRAAAGRRGIPAGLLDLTGGGALDPGRISGRLDGLRPSRVALYRRRDPAAPYLLDAAGLVGSVEADARGRFSFAGLAAGRYYLAFAFGAPRGGVRISGHHGDISLDARTPSVDLPALTVK